MKKVGIREEDKYAIERRVPLTPKHVKRITDKHNIQIEVLQSPKRAFTNEEYTATGCSVVDNLKEHQVIFGIKEVPVERVEANKTYVIFSHVIKGQPHNMPLLKKMMENNCNLIDYECIVNEENKRLIFFGRFAGLAGMLNSLWAFGLRMQHLGVETPFSKLKQMYTYFSLEQAMEAVKEVGEIIKKEGIPQSLLPLTVGLTGYGNVSKGAQEILDLLPVIEISPEELLKLSETKNISNKHIYKIIFKEKHIARHKKGKTFDLNEFFTTPAHFESNFNPYIPHLSMLVNCMYWDDRYDRLITKNHLAHLYSNNQLRLQVIGDITCDPNGSIEATHMGTEIENPIFVYHPLTQTPTFGYKGDGVLIMAVDILPSELPRDSSLAFADALEPFVYEIAACDYSQDYEKLTLSSPIKKALILQNGKLTPKYAYLHEHVKKY